jgi:voltage-gated potassium channel
MSDEQSYTAKLRMQWRDERFTRVRVYEILSVSQNPEDRVSKVADTFLIVLIVLNVLAVMLESVPSIGAPGATEFFIFEGCSVTIFLTEYILRVWSCIESEKWGEMGPIKGRIRYALSPIALTDLVAIIPFFIILSGTDFFDLRFLRILRLRRAFKLTRYSPDMSIVLGVLRDELRLLLALGFVLLLLVVMGSSFIFVLEGADTGPFSSIPGAMAWSLRHLTTLGNTDYLPTSEAGKTFGMVLGIVGVVVIAMISGIFASGFTNAREKRHASLRRFVKIQLVLNEGELNEAAMNAIALQRKHLGFSEPDALEIINEALEEQAGLDLVALRALAKRDDRMLLDE